MSSGFWSFLKICSMPYRNWQEVVTGLCFSFVSGIWWSLPRVPRLICSEKRFLRFVDLPTYKQGNASSGGHQSRNSTSTIWVYSTSFALKKPHHPSLKIISMRYDAFPPIHCWIWIFTERLHKNGWKVLHIWEHELTKLDMVLAKIRKALTEAEVKATPSVLNGTD